MYCEKCGAKIDNNSSFCCECGNQLSVVNEVQKAENSGSSIGWGILGFFIPVSGLTLFLAWKDYRPKDAKAAGIGALIFLVAYILFIVLIFILAFVLGFSSTYY